METFRKAIAENLITFAAVLVLSVVGLNYRVNPQSAPNPPFTLQLIGAAGPKVQAVIYGATWCAPCVSYEARLRKAMPADGWVLKKRGEKGFEDAHIVFDKREDQAAIKADKIEAYPTTIIKRDGREVKRFTGAISEDELADAYNAAGK